MKASDLAPPFTESVTTMFTTMLDCKSIQVSGQPSFKHDSSLLDITAFIGLSGPDRGTVTLTLSKQTALNLASAFIGMEYEEVDEDVTDCVAEMINMIAGGAKVNLPNEGNGPYELGLPTVVQGKDYTISSPAKEVWFDIPFESDLGVFRLQLSFESMKAGNQHPA